MWLTDWPQHSAEHQAPSGLYFAGARRLTVWRMEKQLVFYKVINEKHGNDKLNVAKI